MHLKKGLSVAAAVAGVAQLVLGGGVSGAFFILCRWETEL